MKSQQNLFDITCNVLIEFKKILEKVRPDIVLVHGDTSTTFAAALASFLHKYLSDTSKRVCGHIIFIHLTPRI